VLFAAVVSVAVVLSTWHAHTPSSLSRAGHEHSVVCWQRAACALRLEQAFAMPPCRDKTHTARPLVLLVLCRAPVGNSRAPFRPSTGTSFAASTFDGAAVSRVVRATAGATRRGGDSEPDERIRKQGLGQNVSAQCGRRWEQRSRGGATRAQDAGEAHRAGATRAACVSRHVTARHMHHMMVL